MLLEIERIGTESIPRLDPEKHAAPIGLLDQDPETGSFVSGSNISTSELVGRFFCPSIPYSRNDLLFEHLFASSVTIDISNTWARLLLQSFISQGNEFHHYFVFLRECLIYTENLAGEFFRSWRR